MKLIHLTSEWGEPRKNISSSIRIVPDAQSLTLTAKEAMVQKIQRGFHLPENKLNTDKDVVGIIFIYDQYMNPSRRTSATDSPY